MIIKAVNNNIKKFSLKQLFHILHYDYRIFKCSVKNLNQKVRINYFKNFKEEKFLQ